MNKLKTLISFAFLFTLIACSDEPGGGNTPSVGGNAENYPKSVKTALDAKRGKITGEEGITLVGGRLQTGKNLRGESISRGVNAYLWQASLDTISFMPIATVDATGGVIITDWYQDPNAHGERIKANIVISSDELRASGVKVSLFRQTAAGNGWKDASANNEAARKLEDKILMRARELKIEDDRF